MSSSDDIDTFVGIDYSLSSPALAIYQGSAKNFSWKKVIFYYFMKDQPSFKKDWKKNGKVWCVGNSYECDYRTNIERFSRIGNWVLDCIGIHQTDVEKCRIVIEDYALGAKGRTFEIAENTGILKYKLETTRYKYEVASPTAIKKFATGKGNSDKEKMYDAWLAETENFDLWKQMIPNRQKISSPITDIVDSYFILKYNIVRGTK